VSEYTVLFSSKHVKNRFVYDERVSQIPPEPFKGTLEEAKDLIDFFVSIGDNSERFKIYRLEEQ
jgi:hypothetical protein